nr:hypothetical protein [uncultured Pseudomonas sp.]
MIKIGIMKPTQRVWFIRSSSGKYARHFKQDGIIAIKHLEDAIGELLGDKLPSEEDIKNAMLRNEKYHTVKFDGDGRGVRVLNNSGHSTLSQIKRFANDIKAGDLIITKDDRGDYQVGVCSRDDAFIKKDVIKIIIPDGEEPGPADKIQLKYKFRREVVWGPTISQKNLPSSVKKSVKGQHTITNLSLHKEKVFHLLYPFFTDGEHLYFSNKVKREDSINAAVVGQLFQNLSLAELIQDALLSGDKVDSANIAHLALQRIFKENGVTCQAEFMSPGDIWCKLKLSEAADLTPQILSGVLAFMLITGYVKPSLLETPEHITISEQIKHSENEDDNLFNEKFRPVEASDILQSITTEALENKDELEEIEKEKSIGEIKNNLKLDLIKTRTNRIEDFEFGLNVIEIRGLNESIRATE